MNEVLPKAKLLDRAWELVRELARRPPLTLRYTRLLFTQDLKRAFLDELGHGLAREAYAQRQFSRSAAAWPRSTAPGTRTPGRTDLGSVVMEAPLQLQRRNDMRVSLVPWFAAFTVSLLATGARAEDKPLTTAHGLAAMCQPALRPGGCQLYVQAILDAQLELKARGKLAAPIACNYKITTDLLAEISVEMLKRGVDRGSPVHDAAFSASPATAFLYDFLARKFPC